MKLRKVLLPLLLLCLSVITLTTTTTTVKADDKIYVDVSFIDVGQGDCILINDDNHYGIIDTGAGNSLNALKSALKGVDNIDWMILTHPDADHIQNGPWLIKHYNIKTIYMPDVRKDTKAYKNLKNSIAAHKVTVVNPEQNDVLALKNGKIQFLSPTKFEYEDINSYSIVCKLIVGNKSVLFTGDATGEEIETIPSQRLKADMVKLAHHGSANCGCNSIEFLSDVGANDWIVSCGLHNKYGHPHMETMELAQMWHVNLYRTDLQGTLKFRIHPDEITANVIPSNNYKNGNNL